MKKKTNLNEDIAAIYAAEQKLAKQTQDVIAKIVDVFKNTHLTGVTPIPGKVNCATVSLSTIMQHKHNLSPTYYISNYQAEIIQKRLESYKNLTEVLSFIDEAIQNKYIMCKNEKIILNTAIIAKLEEIHKMF